MDPLEIQNRRILIIDDNEAIHSDFRKILSPVAAADLLDDQISDLFDDEPTAGGHAISFEVDSAFQGQEGYRQVLASIEEGRPYAVAFVDMRMPPGWDGLQTMVEIWNSCPDIQIVMCTAYSDRTWDEIIEVIGEMDKFLILKKPFDPAEVRQLACALVAKWHAHRQARVKLGDLQRMVDEQTSEIRNTRDALVIQNRELDAARETAEAASRAKSDFLANMSHEIRTPMTAILGFSQMLMEDGALAEQERFDALGTIRSNGQKLLGLINDILDLSKIESGRLEVEHVSCSPEEICRDVLELLQVKAAEKNLALEFHDEGMPARILSDPTRMRQVLTNLIGNAIKFTEAGSVRLRGFSGIAEDGMPELHLAVEDDGIGVSLEQQARLFKPFSQADSSTTRRFGGTGLGLSLSRNLARLLGGDISLRSEAGQGSVFTVIIPAEACATEIEATVEAVPSIGGEQADLRGLSVLLVEDGRDNQKLIAMILKRRGVDVEIAENGERGFVRAMEGAFDLVLMDMQMPIKDGYTATRELRDAGYSGPILALTAQAMNGDKERCLAAGCSDFVSKPIDKAGFIAKVAAYASGARSDVETLPIAVVPESVPENAASPVYSTLSDDPDLSDLIPEFIDSLHEWTDDLQVLLEKADWESLASVAHQLKGAAGGYGFAEITEPGGARRECLPEGDTRSRRGADCLPGPVGTLLTRGGEV